MLELQISLYGAWFCLLSEDFLNDSGNHCHVQQISIIIIVLIFALNIKYIYALNFKYLSHISVTFWLKRRHSTTFSWYANKLR